MRQNFQACLSKVLKDEGGYTNDPSDSGGATNYGITIADVRKYINKDATAQDVRNLTVAQASTIYKQRYWDALDCDNLPNGVDYTCFDYGVNSGLQRPRNALKKFASLSGDKLIDAINDERQAFLNNLAARRPKDQKFLKGWTSRVKRVRDYSHVLAGNKDQVTPPAAGLAAGGGLLAYLTQFTDWMHSHPYLTVSIALGSVALVWMIVHQLRNNNE